MRAFVPGEVDEVGGFADAEDGGCLNRVALADEGDDSAVVVGVHLVVEEVDAGNLHGLDDGVDFGRVAAFREVWNVFDESAGHGMKDISAARR